MTSYTCDVDELAAVMAELASCQRALVELSADVDAETQRLHAQWTGLARDAHVSSQGRWGDEFCAMATALDALRGVADLARANYTAAVGANVAMWEQFR